MAKAQPKPDSSDAEAAPDAAPERTNAVTRAMDHSQSPCCEATTKLETLSDALPSFDTELWKQVILTDPTGDEVIAVCTDCGNGVAVVCR